MDTVEIGKCASRVLEERALNRDDADVMRRAKVYGIRAVPTIVIDGRIKVEGKPDFLWMCGDDFYAMLEKRFPLHRPGPAADVELT